MGSGDAPVWGDLVFVPFSAFTLVPGDGNQGIFFPFTLDEKTEQTNRRLFEMSPILFWNS